MYSFVQLNNIWNWWISPCPRSAHHDTSLDWYSVIDGIDWLIDLLIDRFIERVTYILVSWIDHVHGVAVKFVGRRYLTLDRPIDRQQCQHLQRQFLRERERERERERVSRSKVLVIFWFIFDSYLVCIYLSWFIFQVGISNLSFTGW